MLYTKKALQMGAIAVGLAAFAGQSSLAESAKKEDSKPSVRTETMQVMPELTMASHFVGGVNRRWKSRRRWFAPARSISLLWTLLRLWA